MSESSVIDTATMYLGDSRIVLRELPENSFDSCVCDPPYELTSIVKRFGGKNAAPAQFGTDGVFARSAGGFMNQQWDGTGIQRDPSFWAEVLRVLKPGAYLIAFGGTRTYHRMACAVEDAGFEIRDMLAFLHGQGFPKNHDMGEGRGTALKPSIEPLVLARKPFRGSCQANVDAWGTGGLNIDSSRVEGQAATFVGGTARSGGILGKSTPREPWEPTQEGRWPANTVMEHSPLCAEAGCLPEHCPIALMDKQSGFSKSVLGARGLMNTGQFGGLCAIDPNIKEGTNTERGHEDEGGASRFFHRFDPEPFLYQPKPSSAEKNRGCDNDHPTVKSVALMRHFCRLVTPPGGTVLDPFAGSGSCGVAAIRENLRYVGIEMMPEYHAIAIKRLLDATNRVGLFSEEAA